MTSWGVAQAKANLSAVLDKAESEGPQLLKRRNQRFLLLTEESLASLTRGEQAPVEEAPAEEAPVERPFKSVWEALRPPPEDRVDDFEPLRLSGPMRIVEF